MQINTHRLYEHFLSAGFDKRKSEVLAESILHSSSDDRLNNFELDLLYVKENMLTKAELNSFKTELKSELKTELTTLRTELKSELNTEIVGVRKDLEVGLAKLETNIIKWNLGFLLGIAGLFLAYLKYIH